MKMRLALAAIAFFGLSDGAMARAKQIHFNGHCDGMSITISNKIYAAEKTTGCVAGHGVGGGVIGRVKGVTGTWLAIGENTTDAPGAELFYILQYPLADGGSWSSYLTTDGVTISPFSSGTYSLGPPAAVTAGQKSTASK